MNDLRDLAGATITAVEHLTDADLKACYWDEKPEDTLVLVLAVPGDPDPHRFAITCDEEGNGPGWLMCLDEDN